MFQPNFTFRIERQLGLVRAELIGLWTLDVVRAYDLALDAALRTLESAGTARSRAKVLVDRRMLNVLPREVVEACQEVVGRVMRVERVAIVVPNVLSKFQADRIKPGARLFFTEEEALDWLSDDVVTATRWTSLLDGHVHL